MAQRTNPYAMANQVAQMPGNAMAAYGATPSRNYMDELAKFVVRSALEGLPIPRSQYAQQALRTAYPPANNAVGGMAVGPITSFKRISPGHNMGPFSSGSEVHNTSSIQSSMMPGYVVENGIQSVPLSEFYGGKRPTPSYSHTENIRTQRLAEEIRSSRRMDPLIVAIDEQGPYVLEGGHRLDASYLLNATHIPAIVVRENGIPVYVRK